MAYVRPADLPDFDRPPVTEVVLSLQFATLERLANIHAGLLWQEVKEFYPTFEEHPPIPPSFETFGLQSTVAPAPSLQFLNFNVMSRYWFVTNDGTELLQVQPDRLVHNWRKRSHEQQYPRYEPLRERFAHEVATARAFLAQRDLDDIKVNQCEVTYINHISLDEGTDPTRHIDEIFTFWTETYSDAFLERADGAQINIRYLLEAAEGEPYGRLHASIVPAILRDTTAPVVQLTLTARGKPEDESVDAAFSWLDRGREAVVKGFASMTRSEMHRRWGRKHAAR
jgi:uncharacterized protein (TIGR04255 family)